MKKRFFSIFFLIPMLILPFAKKVFAQNSWSITFSGIGTFSSPRVTDLNGDGVGDIVFGAGREEFHACDSAVIALDGVTGKMLWHVASIDQVFGSASLKDLNGDGTQDVFIGGRSAELFAINGRTGKLIWTFDKKQGKKKWYNFYNPQFVADQNGDGIEDILISNGGNVMAESYDESKRYPGNLVVISAVDGKLLAMSPTPDKKETYMSVSACPFGKGNDYRVVFGTGGETIGGNLFVTKLSDILRGDISQAIKLASSPNKGFIAPAVWIDLTGDSIHDIVANAVDGRLLAFDGKSYAPIWLANIPNSEAYSSVAPGNFTDDNIPDFFVSYAIGEWPKLEWSKQAMVDGASGEIAFLDSLGFYQTSSPVVFDFGGDGKDEALLSVNIHVHDERDNRMLYNMLVSLDFKTKEVNQFTDPIKGSNISTTPWIGDMDKDGFLDIVYFHGTNTAKTYSFDGMQVNRMATKIPIKSKIKWGAYMGSEYNGIFEKE